MAVPDFVILNPDGTILGFPQSAEEALDYMWANPGTRTGRSEHLFFGLVPDGGDVQLIIKALSSLSHPSSALAKDVPAALKLVQVIKSEGLYPAKKINAIKECRAIFAIGLGEAKAVIDSYWAGKVS
jgi:hypothetical protein